MRVVEWVRAHVVLSMAIAGALAGAVVGLFLPIRAASPSQVAAEAWRPATQADLTRFQMADLERVRSAPFWNERGRAAGPQVAQWRLVAIVTRPRLQAVVERSGGGDARPYAVAVGGALPDGAVLVAGNRDTVWYEKDGCRRAKRLYAKTTDAADACEGAAPIPAASRAPAPAPASPPGQARNPG